MNNFFYDSADYNLFRKALSETDNESVIINILSTDSSLVEEKKEEEKETRQIRKTFSDKYQASPFGKFFGPRKQRTEPFDMKDFSSWKNKNYREAEKNIGESTEIKQKFSFTDYMNQNSKSAMYSDEDKLKYELQKPITQLSSDDENYKRFSLDSYLQKIEDQAKVKGEFDSSGDLLEPLESDMESIVPTSAQDENFGDTSDLDVENFTFDEGFNGEHFSFEKEELDKVKSRLDKMEREANNIKEKQTEKVISSNELSDLTKEDEFNLGKLGVDENDSIAVDDIEKINEKLDLDDGSNEEKVEGAAKERKAKSFYEVNRNENYKPRSQGTSGDEDVNESNSGQGGSGSVIITGTPATDIAEQSDQEASVNINISDSGAGQGQGGIKYVAVSESALPNAVVTTDKVPETTIVAGVVTEEPKQKSSIRYVAVGESSGSKVGASDFGRPAETKQEKSSEEKVEISQNVDEGEITSNEDITEPEKSIITDAGRTNDVLTKTDFKSITDEIMSKFTELYKLNETNNANQEGMIEGHEMYTGAGYNYGVNGYYDPNGIMEKYPMQPIGQQPGNNAMIQQQQAELQAKILEMIEQNKKSDESIAEKLRLAELEKQKVAEEYENRLKELEKTYKQKDEEAKQQAYIDKLKNDIKLKKAENSHKKREAKIKELEKASSARLMFGENLKVQLKNELNVANLEMDKKLLESAMKKKNFELFEKDIADSSVEDENIDELEEIDKNQDVDETKKTRKTTTSKSTHRRSTRVTSGSRTRKSKRKIDSDIIGVIDFE